MKIAYFDCFSGISGDMILGALIDAGLSVDVLAKELKKINLHPTEYEIEVTKTQKVFMQGTHFNVIEKKTKETADFSHHTHNNHTKHIEVQANLSRYARHLSDIFEIIDNSVLSEKIKNSAKNIFLKLAKAESMIHNIDINEIHFHELSGIDTIIDIIGTLVGLEVFGIEKVYSSPIPVGSGFVKAAHGIMPVPAPATIQLLENVPIYSNGIEDEVTTPTGAAIISTICENFGSVPPMKLLKVGYGAGQKNFTIPNLLRVMIGESIDNLTSKKRLVIETSIDDMNPQIYEYLMQKLFNVGVLDVFFTPIFMKKQRPATLITVLTEPHKENLIAEIIFKETTSIGYRKYFIEKVELEREIYNVNTPWGPVRVKKSNFADFYNFVPEYDDCKKIAQENNIPLKFVIKEVEKIISTNM